MERQSILQNNLFHARGTAFLSAVSNRFRPRGPMSVKLMVQANYVDVVFS